ncbi:MAG: hypothetical protein JXA28_04890 [Bacteroidetes bacterium]|nr:hypothetical protein [Bacteroidota bacterium]
MSTHTHEPNDMLHAWIDGELDPDLEAPFFTHLAADSELREKLRQMRNIRSEAQKYGGSVQPPAGITDRVFSRLGFSAPVIAEMPSGKSSSQRPVVTALRHAWAPVASAAAAAAITAILFLGLKNTAITGDDSAFTEGAPPPVSLHQSQHSFPRTGTDARGETKSASTHTRSTKSRTANPSQPTAPRNRSETSVRDDVIVHGDVVVMNDLRTSDEPSEQPNPLPRTKEIADNDPIARNDLIARNDEPSPAASATPDDERISTTVPSAALSSESENTPLIADGVVGADRSMANLAASQGTVNAQGGAIAAATAALHTGPAGDDVSPVDTRQYFPGLLASEGLRSLSFEFRGMNTTSFPNETIGTSSDPWMQNMAVAVYYSGRRHDIGLEFGQEPFAMHYHGIENGKNVHYEQNLLTPWLLASWRYRFDPLAAVGGIQPYVATSVGSSLYSWPMARAGAGIMYMPDHRVRFQVGVEGSLLAYPYQDVWFTSRRFGLTYGLSILF